MQLENTFKLFSMKIIPFKYRRFSGILPDYPSLSKSMVNGEMVSFLDHDFSISVSNKTPN